MVSGVAGEKEKGKKKIGDSMYRPQFVVIYTVKGFNVVNETEADVFLEFS